MNGLLVKSPWVDLLLAGKKSWEIRGSNTKKRGRVGLIKSGSGMVVGPIDIVDCKKISLFEYQQNQKFHSVDDCLELPYKNTHAWMVENPTLFDEPIPYQHPQGAVIWVDLKKAGVRGLCLEKGGQE